MIKARVTTALLAILTLSTTTLAALTLRREVFGQGTLKELLRAKTVSDWDALRERGTLIGTADAPVTIVEFSDFQCPFCARAQSTVSELHAKYPDQVQIRYRHLPLPMHAHAVAAAEASECANDQGRFLQFSELLFAKQDSIGVKPWTEFAEGAGVQRIDEFDACVTSRRHAERVQDDVEEAERRGFSSTPTFVVNGKILRGAAPIAVLEKEMGLGE